MKRSAIRERRSRLLRHVRHSGPAFGRRKCKPCAGIHVFVVFVGWVERLRETQRGLLVTVGSRQAARPNLQLSRRETWMAGTSPAMAISVARMERSVIWDRCPRIPLRSMRATSHDGFRTRRFLDRRAHVAQLRRPALYLGPLPPAARRHGLAFLAEAELPSMILSNYP